MATEDDNDDDAGDYDDDDDDALSVSDAPTTRYSGNAARNV